MNLGLITCQGDIHVIEGQLVLSIETGPCPHIIFISVYLFETVVDT